jgi:hypothetical protein
MKLTQETVEKLVLFRYQKRIHPHGSTMMVPSTIEIEDGVIEYARERGVNIIIDDSFPVPEGFEATEDTYSLIPRFRGEE